MLIKTNSKRSNNTPPHARITRPTSDGLRTKNFHQQSTIIVVHQLTNNFFLQLPRSTYKTLFIGTRLGEILQTMSFAKSVPERLKLSECKRGIGGKNLPIHYIPEKDPLQEALEKSKKLTTSS
jgi:hypothetical protein